MVARIRTAALSGVEASAVDVEVKVRPGLSHFTIIGLGDGAVRESKDRVVSALRAAGFLRPKQILVNLAPAELRKEGSSYDLPIVLGILVASAQLNVRTQGISFHGELSLDGNVKPIRGVVPITIQALRAGCHSIVVPIQNAAEARLISGIKVVGVRSLQELLVYLIQGVEPELGNTSTLEIACEEAARVSQVWGQESAKRAMVIAAAGGHNLLMIGPPGCGKSMLAERFSSLLPPLENEQALETIGIHSVAGLPLARLLLGQRPFRSPHHLISDAGLIGGGTNPRPGEVSLAHHGVLFLDELPEYRRSAIEALRAPLETGKVTVSRVRASATFPARFQLIAAMNPCPCGRLGSRGQRCVCSRHGIHAYLRKLSQPILDRIDLHVDLEAVPASALVARIDRQREEQEVQWREMVRQARERQLARAAKLNALLSGEEIGRMVAMVPSALALLKAAADKSGMSARGYIRVLRVATTIADLERDEEIHECHIAEAVNLRSLDRIERYCNAA